MSIRGALQTIPEWLWSRGSRSDCGARDSDCGVEAHLADCILGLEAPSYFGKRLQIEQFNSREIKDISNSVECSVRGFVDVPEKHPSATAIHSLCREFGPKQSKWFCPGRERELGLNRNRRLIENDWFQ